jgi:adenosylhomocysteine nucleosidase
MKWITTFCYLFIFVASTHLLAQPTAIIGAMDEEIALLQEKIENPSEEIIGGIHFIKGTLHQRPVIVVKGGIGKVNASMTTTLLLDHFQPTEVIFTGIAGGLNPDLHIGDIVIAKNTVQHDFGQITEEGRQVWETWHGISGKKNPLYFPGDVRLLKFAKNAEVTLEPVIVTEHQTALEPRITIGTVATGDVFVASSVMKEELREQFAADAVEMEGAAVAQVCYQWEVPCLIIRSISDGADEGAGVSFQEFAAVAARNAALLVVALVKQIEDKDN